MLSVMCETAKAFWMKDASGMDEHSYTSEIPLETKDPQLCKHGTSLLNTTFDTKTTEMQSTIEIPCNVENLLTRFKGGNSTESLTSTETFRNDATKSCGRHFLPLDFSDLLETMSRPRKCCKGRSPPTTRSNLMIVARLRHCWKKTSRICSHMSLFSVLMRKALPPSPRGKRSRKECLGFFFYDKGEKRLACY